MERLRLHVAYTGTYFSGWQVQPGARTVQGCLEQALERICGQKVRVHGAGRTDAGVHALGQVAHCDIPEDRAQVAWQRALNGLLPDDMAVTETRWAPPGFHARISARAKEYAYTLWTRPDHVLPQRRPFVWPTGRLDLTAMDRAAAFFLGRQDFTAFQNVGTKIRDPVRTMFSITREPGCRPEEVVWRFTADGFLKQMVRNIMGALAAVGRGRLEPEGVQDLLAAGDRRLAPATAPARGLCLERVMYGPD